MDRKDSVVEFAKYSSSCTLRFKDPDDELRFLQTMYLKRPKFILLAASLGLILHVIFRITALVTACKGSTIIAHSSVACEAALLVTLILVYVAEALLKFFSWLEVVQGAFVYTALPIVLVTAAFNSNGGPYFGTASAFALMCTQTTTSVVINSWWIAGIGNGLVTTYCIAMFYIKFGPDGTVEYNLMASVCIFVSVNFGTLYLYIYERAFRSLYLADKKLQASKDMWRTLLDSLPVGVVIVKQQGRLKFMNKEFRSITQALGSCSPRDLLAFPSPAANYSMESKELEPLARIKDISDKEVTLRDIVLDMRKSGDRDEEKVHHMTLDNKPYEVKTKYIPMSSRKECKIAVVTDQSVYENLVKETTIEKYQRMLLSSISHEIRNPLNAIEGYLTIMKEQALGTVNEYIEKIHASTQQVDLIVAGACDLLLNDSKTTILQPQHFNLHEVIASILSIIQPNVNTRNVVLELGLKESVPRRISSDPKRYKTILFQLLANAVKYTERGKVCVETTYSEEESVLTTIVSDTGIGIPDDKKEKLFQLYNNLEKANTYNPQGMGLGLALCKKLARILGGDLTCESSVGSGSSFTFTIKNYGEKTEVTTPELMFAGPTGEEVHQRIKLLYPSPAVGGHQSVSKYTTSPSYSCKCAQVLIVEDEATNRNVLTHYLKTISVGAEGAENGAEGIRCVKQRLALNECCKKYKLILMDINMPIMDGTEATQKLMKLFERNPSIKTPIVAVTAANMQTRADLQSLLSIGFNDILIKPVSKVDFLERIKGYLEGAP